ncbi:MAG: phosphodiester glycosidase family protein [Verrucomicrobia bacterium]|nr:phosphodiester glycosidase family protein [Verrucomicrobiota bacterium]
MNRVIIMGFVIVALLGKTVAVEYSEAQIAGKRITVCRVNVSKEPLQLYLRDDKGQTFKRFDRLSRSLDSQGKKLSFAMNAGMYHGDFSPVGLFISDGKQLVPLNLANAEGNFFLKPNGVFLISDQGARIVESSEYPNLRERVQLATQSGPLLLRAGKLHPAFNPDSKSRLYRNGVGVPSPDIALFAISEAPVNFHEFAVFFRDVLRCPDALFLDGTISSLHSTKLKRSDFKMDLGPIIGITETK